jgi:queuine tRNA-ribosyltransferase
MKTKLSKQKNKTNPFKIISKDEKTKARVGILKTKSGLIETPFFMPVATKAAVKYISSAELKDIGVGAVISNTFVLHLKPCEKVVKRVGGIKKYMNFKGINVTDSGGFQMYSPSLYIKSNTKGVWFRNPYNGSKIFVSPEKDMEIQLDIGSDVAMCLDTMPLIEHSKKDIEIAVNQTYDWAVRCKKHHNKKNKQGQLLFGICQGGIHKDLRKKSAEQIASIGFDGLAIGGLALGEGKEDEYKMIDVAKSVYPEDKVCYLMGAGDPIEILEAISRGVDMFDSRFPTQNARRGTLFTSKGRLRLFNSRFKDDKKPIASKCGCYACKNFSRAYIRSLLIDEEPIGRRLASIHNIYYLIHMIKGARVAIRKGKFNEFMKNVKKAYQ